MASQTNALKNWIQTLPASRMVYPGSLKDRMKYVFWRMYTPYHSFVRDTLLFMRIIRHEGRQDYLIGHVAPHESLESIVSALVKLGYGNHFVAWEDEGQIISLRYVDSFEYQYHVRIFADGEVRGHYEYTPECYPIKHIKEVGQEDRRAEILRHLGSSIIPL